jgi:hypothetical protein
MSFQRQLQRASINQQMEMVQETVQALHEESLQLKAEIKSLHRAMGAVVQVSGGEVRIPKDIDSILKGKNLQSDLDEDTGEYVFRVVEVAAAVEETTKEDATK